MEYVNGVVMSEASRLQDIEVNDTDVSGDAWVLDK
jgi:hypothetical protein